MFGKQVDAAREAFEAQFEDVAGGVHFRPGGVGEPFRLTAAERAEAIAAFETRMKRVTWSMMAVLFGALGIMAWFSLDADFSIEIGTFAIIAVVMGGYILAYRRAMHAPARRHAGRQVPGENRSKAEMRAVELRKMSWSQIGLSTAALLVLIWVKLSEEVPGSNAFWAWLLFGGAILSVVLVRSVRKFRLPPED